MQPRQEDHQATLGAQGLAERLRSKKHTLAQDTPIVWQPVDINIDSRKIQQYYREGLERELSHLRPEVSGLSQYVSNLSVSVAQKARDLQQIDRLKEPQQYGKLLDDYRQTQEDLHHSRQRFRAGIEREEQLEKDLKATYRPQPQLPSYKKYTPTAIDKNEEQPDLKQQRASEMADKIANNVLFKILSAIPVIGLALQKIFTPKTLEAQQFLSGLNSQKTAPAFSTNTAPQEPLSIRQSVNNCYLPQHGLKTSLENSSYEQKRKQSEQQEKSMLHQR